MNLRSAIAVFAAATVLAGCQSVDGAIQEHGAKTKTVLSGIAPLASDLRARAAVTRDDVPAIEPLVVMNATPEKTDNAAVVYYEDLLALGELGNVYARIPGTKHVSECASLLQHRTLPWDPHDSHRWNEPVTGFDVAKSLESCSTLRTLFVIRTMELVKPSGARVETRPVDGGAEGGTLGTVSTPSESTCRVANVQCKFDGGQMKAEVHVFTIEPFAYKGALLLDVESSEKIRLSGAWSDVSLELDLADRVGVAFEAAMLKQIPGAVVRGFH